MVLRNYKDLVDMHLDGKESLYSFRKNISQATTAGVWFDLSSTPGKPNPQYFAGTPLKATALSYSNDGGFIHGQNVSPSTKYLRKVGVITNTTNTTPYMIMDYLMFYPFCSDAETDPQTMDNTVTLPRYTSGEGVRVMAVSQGARTGGQTFSINYTNSDGVAGRVSPNVTQCTATAVGSVISSDRAVNGTSGCFIPLQDNDKGVRSIESVTMNGSDVGIFALVLVKPLASFVVQGNANAMEKDFLLADNSLPIIQDDAYLNMVIYPLGTMSGVNVIIDMLTAWE